MATDTRLRSFTALAVLAFLSLLLIVSLSGPATTVHHSTLLRRQDPAQPSQPTAPADSAPTSATDDPQTSEPPLPGPSSSEPPVTTSQTSISQPSSSPSRPAPSPSLPPSSAPPPPETTPPPSSSIVPSSAPSSSPSSSSSSSSTIPFALTPITTIDLFATTVDSLAPPPPTDTPADNQADVVAASASSRFWNNKGAVAATFLVTAIAALAIAAFLVINVMKRRLAKQQARDARFQEENFETYTSDQDYFRSHSPQLSLNAAPMNAFARQEVDNSPFQDMASQPTIVVSSAPVQHPDYYNTPVSHYTPHSQWDRAGSEPLPAPTPRLDIRGSYQPSIDSFYGAGHQSPVTGKGQAGRYAS